MNHQNDKNGMNIRTALLVLIAATLLSGFSNGRWLAPLAAWLGPVLFMRFTRDYKSRHGYWALLAVCIIAVNINYWNVFPINITLTVLPAMGLLITLPFLADRWLARRFEGFVSTLVYPLAFSTMEWATSLLNPFGTWSSMAYTQFGNLLLMQLVSVTGMIGIAFLMGWFASVINWVWEEYHSNMRDVFRGLSIFGAVVAAVLLFGFMRLDFGAKPADTIRVVGITPASVRELSFRWHRNQIDTPTANAELTPIHDAYFEATSREADAGAKVIIWPELAAMGTSVDEAALIARAQKIAKQENIYLALPMYTFYFDEEHRNENKMVVIDPDGEIALEHIKYGGNFIEGTLLGNGQLQYIKTPFGLVSGVVCWDADFPQVIRQAGQAGVGLFIIPSSDWEEITPVHGDMAVFRAIENGMSIVRETDNGLSIASDPYGRVLSQRDYFTTTDRTMVAQVPTKHVNTLYSTVGYQFGWLLVVGFGVILVWGLIGRRSR